MDVHQQIECPLCQKAESDFQLINERINHARTIAEKASYARELLQKVETVLKEHEKVEGGLGEACQSVLNLRKKAAELILKFEK
jgi:hypothetical protein